MLLLFLITNLHSDTQSKVFQDLKITKGELDENF